MINLDPSIIAILGVLVFILLLLMGVSIGIAMAIVGFAGIVVLKGFTIALATLFIIPYSSTASWLLSVIPMFILMGSIAFHCGFTRDAYNTAYRWVGRFPAGLAVATLIGAAAFGACSGSSVAATAALGKLALPEMIKYGYNKKLAAGVVAMGGTLAALIPPSILMVIYGIVTEVDIGKLLIAGILPGVLSMALFALLAVVWASFRPGDAPRGEKFSSKEKIVSLPKMSGILVLFLIVAGGILSGLFTPTEAGAVGAFVILIMAIMIRRFNWGIFKEVIFESLRVVSSIFLILVGAYIFIQFVALSRAPVVFAEWVAGFHFHRIIIIVGIIIVYLILGCFIDALGMILLTVPFISPTIFALGFDPIWFGVMVVKLVEIGALTPPVGIQSYVLKGVAPEIPLRDIFLGFVPFIIVDILLFMGLIIAFPQIATFLPSLMG